MINTFLYTFIFMFYPANANILEERQTRLHLEKGESIKIYYKKTCTKILTTSVENTMKNSYTNVRAHMTEDNEIIILSKRYFQLFIHIF